MLDSLKGYKTYIVVAIAVLSAILGYFDGQLTLLQALQAIGLAVGIGGNRAIITAAAVLNSPYRGPGEAVSPFARQLTVYAGVALTILTAVLAAINDQQGAVATIGAILGALGLNFLGVGAKKAATGDAT